MQAQIHSFVISEDRYEEDLYFECWNMTSRYFHFFLVPYIFLIYLDLNMPHAKNQLPIFVISGDRYEEDL